MFNRILLAALPLTTLAWVPNTQRNAAFRSSSQLEMAKVGVFFGTSTGNCQEAADAIAAAFGSDAEVIDVDTLGAKAGAAFSEHDTLVCGAPTWNTGSEVERSGTGWDEIIYNQLPDVKDALSGKKVAVFGVGDQVSYSDYFCDAAAELYDVFEGFGCDMKGLWPIDDSYEHDDSKCIKGDNFVGLLLDYDNQGDLTEERVEKWVAQLKGEGFA